MLKQSKPRFRKQNVNQVMHNVHSKFKIHYESDIWCLACILNRRGPQYTSIKILETIFLLVTNISLGRINVASCFDIDPNFHSQTLLFYIAEILWQVESGDWKKFAPSVGCEYKSLETKVLNQLFCLQQRAEHLKNISTAELQVYRGVEKGWLWQI